MIHHRSRAKEEASFATTSMNGQQCSVGIAVSLMMLDLLLSSWREVEKSRQLWDLPPLLWETKGEGGTECGRTRKLQKARKKIFLLLVLLCSSLFSLDCYVTPCFGGSIQMACATLLMQLVVRTSHRRLKCWSFSVSSWKTCHFQHVQRQQGCLW